MNPWRGLEGLPRAVWVMAWATLVNRAGTMALPFLVLYQTQALHFSVARAGQAFLIYGLGAFIAGPLAGRLSDRIGALTMMRGSLLLSGLLLLLVPLVKAYLPFLAVLFTWALVSEGFRPANLAMLAELAPEGQRKAVFALNRLAINLGMSMGPAVGGFIATVSYSALFWVDGVTSLVAFVVLSLFVQQTSRPAGHRALPSATGLSDGRFRYFLLACLPVLVVFFQHEGALPVFLVDELRFTPAFYGTLFTVNTLLIVAFEVKLNLAMANWPHRRSLALGAWLYAIGFGGTALATTRAGIIATVVVWTFAEMILLPTMSDYVAHIAPSDRIGEYMGLYTTTFSVAFSVGPWLGTLAYERLGSLALWLGCFGVGAVSALMFARVQTQPQSN